MLALTVLSVAFGGLCALFAYPQWSEWREKRKQSPRVGAMRARSIFVPLGVASVALFTISAVFLGEWLYLRFYSVYPRTCWGILLLVLAALLGAWWLLARNVSDAVEDAKTLRDSVAVHEAEVYKWKVEYEKKSLEHRELQAATQITQPATVLSVEFEPTKGRSAEMFLKVTNKGGRQEFYAQCTILSNPVSPKLEAAFNLGWESGIDKLPLVREQTGNLLIATAWDDRDPDHRHEAGFAGMGLQKLTGVIFREIEPERWRKYEKVNLPSYRLRIAVFGQKTQTSKSQEYILKPGTSCALEMSPIGVDGDSEALFTTLQTEVFRLAQELRSFLDDIGPRPKFDRSPGDGNDTPARLGNLANNTALAVPWLERLRHEYAARFADRVTSVVHRLGAEGVPIMDFEQRVGAVDDEKDVRDIAGQLPALAIKLDCLLDRRRPKRDA